MIYIISLIHALIWSCISLILHSFWALTNHLHYEHIDCNSLYFVVRSPVWGSTLVPVFILNSFSNTSKSTSIPFPSDAIVRSNMCSICQSKLVSNFWLDLALTVMIILHPIPNLFTLDSSHSGYYICSCALWLQWLWYIPSHPWIHLMGSALTLDWSWGLCYHREHVTCSHPSVSHLKFKVWSLSPLRFSFVHHLPASLCPLGGKQSRGYKVHNSICRMFWYSDWIVHKWPDTVKFESSFSAMYYR